MSHHHRRKDQQQENTSPQGNNMNMPGNIDFASMLGNLNLNNIDFSKIDFNKVQSMMEKMKMPNVNNDNDNDNGNTNSGSPISNSNDADPRIGLINSLKPFMPRSRARTLDNISKIFQITKVMNKSGNSKG